MDLCIQTKLFYYHDGKHLFLEPTELHFEFQIKCARMTKIVSSDVLVEIVSAKQVEMQIILCIIISKLRSIYFSK